jgi:DNA polymerase-3 subunit epsilon
MNFFYFDTETTGLPNRSRPMNDTSQPHITQLGGVLEVNQHDALVIDTLVKPNGWAISPTAQALTGITKEMCVESGIPIGDVLNMFMTAVANADFIVCHNAEFDRKLVMLEYHRMEPEADPTDVFEGVPALCTMQALTPILKLKKKDGRAGFKWPKLEEAVRYLFGEELDGAHNAMVDITATRRCFHWCVNEGLFDKAFEARGLTSRPTFDAI